MTKRIALVPYEPGQEPEGMVSSLDPGDVDDRGFAVDMHDAVTRRTEAIRVAAEAAKRGPWEEWRESLRLPWANTGRTVRDADGEMLDSDATDEQRTAMLAIEPMAEALRKAVALSYDMDAVSSLVLVRTIARAALRKAGAPVDEPKTAEDVPELWVSRDDGGWADAWDKEPTWSVIDGWGIWEGPSNWRIPRPVADALDLKPGDCRRVTSAEYERFFRPVLDLPPSERYAALERLVP